MSFVFLARPLLLLIYLLKMASPIRAESSTAVGIPQSRDENKRWLVELERTIHPHLEEARRGEIPPRQIIAKMRSAGVEVRGIKMFRRIMMKEERARAVVAADRHVPGEGRLQSSVVNFASPKDPAAPKDATLREEPLIGRRRSGGKKQRSWTVKGVEFAPPSSASSLSESTMLSERWGGLPPDIASSVLAFRDALPSDLERAVAFSAK